MTAWVSMRDSSEWTTYQGGHGGSWFGYELVNDEWIYSDGLITSYTNWSDGYPTSSRTCGMLFVYIIQNIYIIVNC